MDKLIFCIFMFIIGTCFSSFFGLLIYRINIKENIIMPSSHCDKCNHVLRIYEKIPIVSYILLKGKCSNCGNKIDIFYFIYEIIGGFILFTISFICPINTNLIFISIISLILLLIAGYDYKTKIVPDIFLIILFVSCCGYYLYKVIYLNEPFYINIVCMFITTIILIILRIVMSKILKQEALGLGDIYLISIMCLVLSPYRLVLSIFIASILAILISIKNKYAQIAFCPYLCIGFYIMLLI